MRFPNKAEIAFHVKALARRALSATIAAVFAAQPILTDFARASEPAARQSASCGCQWGGASGIGGNASIYAANALSITASQSYTNNGTETSATEVIQSPSITIGTTNPNPFGPQGRTGDTSLNLSYFLSANSPSVAGAGLKVGGHVALSSGSFGGPLPAANPRTVTLVNPNGSTSNVTYLYNSPVPSASSRSPDWVLQASGQNVQNVTFLADSSTEALIVEKAALAATGSTLLDPSYTNPAQQDAALQQAAVDYANATGARFGTDLTAAQKAALTKPMLWYVTQNINGQNVLVPELLLPPGFTAPSQGDNIDTGNLMVIGDDVTNAGTVHVSGNAVIIANNFTNAARPDGVNRYGADPEDAIANGQVAYAPLNIVGGSINVGGNLLISASGDITNSLGTIKAANIGLSGDNIVTTGNLIATGDVDISARGTFVDAVPTIAVNGNNGVSGNLLLHGGNISAGGNVSIVSGGDLDIIGGTVSAGNNAALVSLGGDVNIVAQQVTQSYQDIQGSGKVVTSTNTLNVGSNISAGGSLGIASLNGSITLQSSNLSATNIGLDAAKDVNFLAGIDTRQTIISGKADNGITTTIYNQGNVNQSVAYDQINGNLTINAAGINMDYLAATNNSTMGANGQLQLVSSSTQTAAQAIAGLAGQAGYGWMNTVANGNIPVSYNGLTTDNASWNNTTTTVDPVVAAFISLVTAVLMPGALGALGIVGAGSALGAGALAAGASAFASGIVSGTIIGAISGKIDFGSIVLSALASGLTAGLTNGINANFFAGAPNFALSPTNIIATMANGGITPQMVALGIGEAGVDAAIQAGLSSALTGSKFGSSFETDFAAAIANDVVEPILMNEAGTLLGKLPAGSPEAVVLHAIVGAIGGGITNGVKGAEGGALGGALGQIVDSAIGVTPGQMPSGGLQDITEIIGALASLAVGDASMSGAMAALNGLIYNDAAAPHINAVPHITTGDVIVGVAGTTGVVVCHLSGVCETVEIGAAAVAAVYLGVKGLVIGGIYVWNKISDSSTDDPPPATHTGNNYFETPDPTPGNNPPTGGGNGGGGVVLAAGIAALACAAASGCSPNFAVVNITNGNSSGAPPSGYTYGSMGTLVGPYGGVYTPTGTYDTVTGNAIFTNNDSYFTLNGTNTQVPSPYAPNSNISANYQAGIQFQNQVSSAAKLTPNTTSYTVTLEDGTTVTTIPDSMTGGVTEIKNVANLTYTEQLQGQIQYATNNNLSFNLYVSPTTNISGPLETAIENAGGTIKQFDPSTGVTKTFNFKTGAWN